jgi:hypothetical protein
MEQMPRGKRIQPCGGLLPWSAGGLGKWKLALNIRLDKSLFLAAEGSHFS